MQTVHSFVKIKLQSPLWLAVLGSVVTLDLRTARAEEAQPRVASSADSATNDESPSPEFIDPLTGIFKNAQAKLAPIRARISSYVEEGDKNLAASVEALKPAEAGNAGSLRRAGSEARKSAKAGANRFALATHETTKAKPLIDAARNDLRAKADQIMAASCGVAGKGQTPNPETRVPSEECDEQVRRYHDYYDGELASLAAELETLKLANDTKESDATDLSRGVMPIEDNGRQLAEEAKSAKPEKTNSTADTPKVAAKPPQTKPTESAKVPASNDALAWRYMENRNVVPGRDDKMCARGVCRVANASGIKLQSANARNMPANLKAAGFVRIDGASASNARPGDAVVWVKGSQQHIGLRLPDGTGLKNKHGKPALFIDSRLRAMPDKTIYGEGVVYRMARK